jgi:hypothetical protein
MFLYQNTKPSFLTQRKIRHFFEKTISKKSFGESFQKKESSCFWETKFHLISINPPGLVTYLTSKYPTSN